MLDAAGIIGSLAFITVPFVAGVALLVILRVEKIRNDRESL